MNIQVDLTSSNLASAMFNSKIMPRAVVGYGVKIFHPSPPNYVTRSPRYIFIFKYLLCVLTQNQFNLIAIDIGHFSTNLISLDKKSISFRFIFLPFSFLQVFCFSGFSSPFLHSHFSQPPPPHCPLSNFLCILVIIFYLSLLCCCLLCAFISLA